MQNRKYLVVGPSWVGDMVMAQSLFKRLKVSAPEALIDVLAPNWTAAITERMPEVNKLIDSGLVHKKLQLSQRWKLAKSLRAENYTHAIVLPNSIKSALVPWLAKIPIRRGFVGEQRYGLLNNLHKLNKQTLPMTVQRFVALGFDDVPSQVAIDSVQPPHLVVDKASAQKLAQDLGLKEETPILAICPGAEFGNSKQWPAEYYAQVVDHYAKMGWQSCILGSASDVAIAQHIASTCDSDPVISAGKTSLNQAVDLLSLADLVVSNDSGLMHIAAALHRPLVAIYGSTDPSHTPPLSGNHRIAKTDIDCSPCFQRECPLQHHRCMGDLSKDQVIHLADQAIAMGS